MASVESKCEVIGCSNERYRTQSICKGHANERRRHNYQTTGRQKDDWYYTESGTKCRMLYAARKRAEDKDLPFTITKEDIVIPSHCPIFGVKLKNHKGPRQTNSPSLDKFHPSGGYTPINIAVISDRANVIKGDATAIELRQIADWMDECEKFRVDNYWSKHYSNWE